MKKILMIILALLMVLGQTPILAYADANESKMYSVPAEGEMEGWLQLKGHSYEKEFEIYFKLNGSELGEYVTKDLRNIDLTQVVEWTDEDGQIRENTIEELYKMFSKIDSILTEKWLGRIFGNVYHVWASSRLDNISALGELELYLSEKNNKKSIQNMPSIADLKPSDYKIVDADEANGVFVFKAYDKDGKLLGKYKDEDDGYVVAARIEHKDLPPRLSEGWINYDLISKFYNYYCTSQDKELVITTSPIGPKPEELIRLKLPDNWLRDGEKEIKVNGIRIQKYTLDELNPEEQWFSKEDIVKKIGLSVSATGESLYSFAICGAYDSETGLTKKLFKASWPKDWWDKKDQNETVLNGLRVKRKNNVDYFNVEDLGKLNILKSAAKDYQIYLNISDLQNAGIIK